MSAVSSSSAGKRKGDDELENGREQKRFKNEDDKEETVQLTLALLAAHADSVRSIMSAEGDVVHVPALRRPLRAGKTPDFFVDQMRLADYLSFVRIDGIVWTIRDPKTDFVQFETYSDGTIFTLEDAIDNLRAFILFAMENYKPDTDSTHNVFLRAFEIAEGIGRALAPLQGISVTSVDEKLEKINKALSICASEIPRVAGKVALVPPLSNAFAVLEKARDKFFGWHFSENLGNLVLMDSKNTTVSELLCCLHRAVDISLLKGFEESITVVLRFFSSGVVLNVNADTGNRSYVVKCCSFTLTEMSCDVAHDL
jgi:hypothetical protein